MVSSFVFDRDNRGLLDTGIGAGGGGRIACDRNAECEEGVRRHLRP